MNLLRQRVKVPILQKSKMLASITLSQIGRLFPRKGVPVLLYHSIDDSGSVISITTDEFKAQMKYLNDRKYQTLSLIQFYEYLIGNAVLPSKTVLITFDDGFKNNYSEVLPILRMYGFTATIFLTTSQIGGVLSWDADETIPRLPLLSWNEIVEMSDFGIDFGAHTCTHPYLTKLSIQEQQKEILCSRLIIEENIKKPVKFFCYPYGDRNCMTQQAVKECGYLGAFGGLNYRQANSWKNLYDLNRIGTARFRSLYDFEAGLLGTYQCYIRLRRISNVFTKARQPEK